MVSLDTLASRTQHTFALVFTSCVWVMLGQSVLPAENAALTAKEPAREEYHIPMRDGVHLATDVWLPATNQAFPVVFLRFPYNKQSAAGLGRDGTGHGYAVVAQDTRGRFASEGENLPFHLDVQDGEDTIDWIIRQPWCNGKLGTWGGSAGAITQFQLAVDGTGEVNAQYLVVGEPNLYQGIYVGGIFRKALSEDWIRGTGFATNALGIWVSHPGYDQYWQARDASRHYALINTPAVHVGGYWDIFAQGTLNAFKGYQTEGGSRARGNQKLLFGPWAHGPLQAKVGELEFPGGDRPPGKVQDHWRWFNHWLKGQNNGVDRDPAVTYYVIGDVTDPRAPGNEWRTTDQWPPFAVSPTRYYLHADRTLSRQAPEQDGSLAYTYDPADPVPTLGGSQLTIPAGPKDQTGIESRQDVLVFSTEPLVEPIEVTGRVRARLWISSDAPDTDFFVRLCDVYPDGRSFNLCEGMLRARFRLGFDREEFLEPGEIYALDIDCWSTSVIFARNHRIRVHVTSSSAPGFDPNPNTGEPFRSSDRRRPARNTIHLKTDHPSCILLPIVTAP